MHVIFQKIHYQTTMRTHYLFVIATFLVIFSAFPALAEQLSGRVVGIHDGDTVTVLTADKRSVRTRLVEIDAPESGQPYGMRAKQALSGLVFDKQVIVEVSGIDRYGRTLGRLFHDGMDVNAEMVRLGYAWVYRRYATDETLFDLEEAARTAKRGLWSLPLRDQVPPWEWRRKSPAWTR